MRADRSRGQARFKRLEDLQRKVQIVPLTKGIGARDCLWFEVEQLQTEHLIRRVELDDDVVFET